MKVSDLLGSIDQYRGNLETVLFTHFDDKMGCPIAIDKFSIYDVLNISGMVSFRVSKIISWYTFYDDDNVETILVVQI